MNLTHHPHKLLDLLDRDYLFGPNWYYRVRDKLHKALRLQRPVRFELKDHSHYGGQVLVQIDGQTQPLTKGKLRWSELTFYGLYPQENPAARTAVAQAA